MISHQQHRQHQTSLTWNYYYHFHLRSFFQVHLHQRVLPRGPFHPPVLEQNLFGLVEPGSFNKCMSFLPLNRQCQTIEKNTKHLTLTNCLASSSLDPQLDSWQNGCCCVYVGSPTPVHIRFTWKMAVKPTFLVCVCMCVCVLTDKDSLSFTSLPRSPLHISTAITMTEWRRRARQHIASLRNGLETDVML